MRVQVTGTVKPLIGSCVLSLLVACGGPIGNLEDGREVAAYIAPDMRSKAFVWLPELGGLGATTSQPYQVWIQYLQGQERRSLIFEADKTDGVRLAWKTSNVLEICYQEAQITHFNNFFVVAAQDSPHVYRLEIVLRKVSSLAGC